MQTVVETAEFIRAIKTIGLTQALYDELIALFAAEPDAGEPMSGTGGFRKVRFARPGMGKRSGCRVISFYSGVHIPVFLITVFAKNEKVNLSKAEQNALNATGKQIVTEYEK